MRKKPENQRYRRRDAPTTQRLTKQVPGGFTLVEILVALAISAMLLTAMSLAFNASVMNFRENEDMFKAVNRARQALFRITTQVRTAAAVDPDAPANECSLITDTGQDITYRFDAGTGRLYLVTNDDTSDPDYVLCEEVTEMTFTKTTAVVDSVTVVKGVQVAMTVTAGSAQKKLAAAAVVRRNLD